MAAIILLWFSLHPDPASQEGVTVTTIQVMLYVVGAMSVVAFVWTTLAARRRRAKRRHPQTNA